LNPIFGQTNPSLSLLRDISADQLYDKYKGELHDLQMQLDNKFEEPKELRRKQGEVSSTNYLQVYDYLEFVCTCIYS